MLMAVLAGHALAIAGVVAAQPLPRVEVTGSSIRRADLEPPAPVEIISREQIRLSGATTVDELLMQVPTADRFDTGGLSSISPGTTGTALVALRGLEASQALVLVNGRRMPVNPLASNSGSGAAFDINQIPVSAIERIEILKDSSSAIYGSDAVAGVVNIILRRDHRGIEVRGTAGISSRGDAAEQQAGLSAGFGDLAADRYNVVASLEHFRRDPLLRRDRDISRTADFRRFGPIPGFNLDARSPLAQEGNIVSPAGVPTGMQVRPCPPERLSGGLCRYDFNADDIPAYNGADRWAVTVGGTLQLAPGITAHAHAIVAAHSDMLHAPPANDFFTAPGGTRYAGRIQQAGPRLSFKQHRFLHLETGLQGAVGLTDWQVDISRGKARTTNTDRHFFARSTLAAAIASGAIDPTVNTNDPTLLESLKIAPVRSASSTIDLLDAAVSGDAFAAPGGKARYALGVNLWRERLSDRPDPLQSAGDVIGSIQQAAVEASRTARALFAELQLPVTQAVEAQLAARYDRFGETDRLSSKLAAKWHVFQPLALRASYSESFKMPTLKQLFAESSQGALTLNESQCVGAGLPAGCAGTPAFRVTGANPDLRPELGKSYTLGFVADNGPASLGIDYWRIDKRDNIGAPSIDLAIQQGFVGRDEAGRLLVFTNLQNFARSRNSGVDLDARLALPATPVGRLSLRAAATYYEHDAQRNSPSSPWEEFTGTYATPRWRGVFSATAQHGPWTVQGLLRSVGGFWDTTRPHNAFGTLPPGGLRRVRAYEEFDLTVSYGGVRELTLTATVKNLFDRMPPFSATNATNNAFSTQGFAELYTSRGRYFQIGAVYAFR